MEMRGIFGARRQSLNANVQVAKRNVQNKNFVRFNGFFCVSRNLSTGSLDNLNRLDVKKLLESIFISLMQTLLSVDKLVE